ncbi:MAG: cupin domain-containing protein [Planctomycetota bacterium]
MLLKRLQDSEEILANDGCRLRELLHRDRDSVDEPYSLAWATIDPGKSTLPHRLREQSELYWVVSGQGRIHVGEETSAVHPGDAILVPKNELQWIENAGTDPLCVVLIVSPPWMAEDDVREPG